MNEIVERCKKYYYSSMRIKLLLSTVSTIVANAFCTLSSPLILLDQSYMAKH